MIIRNRSFVRDAISFTDFHALQGAIGRDSIEHLWRCLRENNKCNVREVKIRFGERRARCRDKVSSPINRSYSISKLNLPAC